MRRPISFFGWVALAIYTAAALCVMVVAFAWPGAFLLGVVVILIYGGFVIRIWGLHKSDEPTEWMRRGGLMASPDASARPDDARIRKVLSMLPHEVRTRVSNGVEAYLAMPDDDDKQLCRDSLIREFYAAASSSKSDFASRKAYNDLRLALSPWAECDSDERA